MSAQLVGVGILSLNADTAEALEKGGGGVQNSNLCKCSTLAVGYLAGEGTGHFLVGYQIWWAISIE